MRWVCILFPQLALDAVLRQRPDPDEPLVLLNGQIVVARLDGEVTIKRFERVGTTVRLLPRNPAYQPIVVRDDQDLAIEGVFCGLVRQG